MQCARRGWACLAAAEDRVALENEIARLRGETPRSSRTFFRAGLPLPPGAMPEPPAAHDNDITIRLPDNADLDRAVSYVGQMWQRFVDAVVRAQKQMLNKS